MKKLISLLLCALLLTSCAATYDGPTEENPMLTEHLVRHYSPFFDDTVQENRTTFAYDIYGNRVQTMDYRDGELHSVTKMRYDDRGNVISVTYWDHTGWIPLPDGRVEQTYDEQDRLLTYTHYDKWGRKTSESTYTYDDEAHTTTFEGDTDRVVYYYDVNGLLLRDVADTLAGTVETVYTYDDQGNRIGWTSTLNGEPHSRLEAGYDDQNRQIWGKHYDENGVLASETTYTYDDEAHAMSYNKPGGGKRIEYYYEDGRPSLIEDYAENGELSMYQQYYYRDIRVPMKEE